MKGHASLPAPTKSVAAPTLPRTSVAGPSLRQVPVQPPEGERVGSDSPAIMSALAWSFADMRVHTHAHETNTAARVTAQRPPDATGMQARPVLQAKLKVGESHSPDEKEADRVADTVTRSTQPVPAISRLPSVNPPLRRACAACGKLADAEAEGLVQLRCDACSAAAERGDVADSLGARIEARRGAGEPLPAATRASFEARFQRDFGGVRVHKDGEAAQLSHSLGARAFTVGHDVYFGRGAFAPGTSAGDWLLAHELTHTVQQGAAGEARVQRATTDAQYESGVGVAAGTMTPVPGVDGQTFTASGCRGSDPGIALRLANEVADDAARMNPPRKAAQIREDVREKALAATCSVSFKFDRALQGDYPYQSAGGKMVRGVHVIISMSYTSKECGDCAEVKPVQIVRSVKKSGGKLVTDRPNTPTRRTRSGWGTRGAPSRGWRIDEVDSGHSPFYVSSDFYGQNGSSTTPAVLRDSPGDWDTDRNVGRDFRTCAVCYNPDKKGVTLGCIDWGYHTDAAGVITFLPAAPKATCNAAELGAAAKRWDKISGNAPVNLGS